jgi:hypothetical protein
MFDTGLQSVFDVTEMRTADEPLPRSDLFHRLNNQLGIVLAHTELLEAKLTDGPSRARAGQVLASVMGALSTAREIRNRFDDASKEPLRP